VAGKKLADLPSMPKPAMQLLTQSGIPRNATVSQKELVLEKEGAGNMFQIVRVPRNPSGQLCEWLASC
jgi:hypothetical protein